MAVSVEAEREAQRALLKIAREIGQHGEEFDILHRLVELELGAGEPARAREWLAQAEGVLEKGGLELRFHERQRHLDVRVESAEKGQSTRDTPGAGATATDTTAASTTVSAETRSAAASEDTQGTDASDSPAVEVKRAAALQLGVALDRVPERYGYIRDKGPAIPEHVHYIQSTVVQRSAGIGSWIALIFYMSLVLIFAIMLFANISTGDALFAAISAGLILLFGGLGALTGYRIRTARADRRAFAAGEYRLGWYMDGDALVLRAPSGFSVFPRAQVKGARVDVGYDSESKQTVRRLALEYLDNSRQATEIVFDDAYATSRAKVAETINRWKDKGKDHGRV